MGKQIPRDASNDYSPEIIAEAPAVHRGNHRRELNHTKRYSFDPEEMAGNIESLFGVAQVPIGLAGPLLITANTPRESSTCPWRPSRAPCSRATTAA
jgi:hydroxymethylglutaryl-CoA reductase (NADPH)